MTSALDEYLGTRRGDGVPPTLTDADFQTAFTQPPESVQSVARMLLRLMGSRKDYRACGDKMREDLKNCARKLLRNARGDLDGVLELEAQVEAAQFLAGALKMALSPYGLVPKLVTLYEKQAPGEDEDLYRELFDGSGPLTEVERRHLAFMKAEEKWPPS